VTGHELIPDFAIFPFSAMAVSAFLRLAVQPALRLNAIFFRQVRQACCFLKGKYALVSVLLAAAVPCVVRAGDNPEALANAADAAANRAKALAEMALTAMENAMAAVDESQAAVLAAVRSDDPKAMAAAEKKWKAATEAAEQARSLVNVVLEASAECRAAAVSVASGAAALSGSSLAEDEKRAVIRRMAQKLEIARRALRRAEEAFAVLKRKWLDADFGALSLPSAPIPAATTTAIPPSPTPVGRR